MEGEKVAKDKVTKRRIGKDGVERRKGPRGPLLGSKGCTWIFVQGPRLRIVTPLLMVPVCLISQGRFEDPVRPWTWLFLASCHQ